MKSIRSREARMTTLALFFSILGALAGADEAAGAVGEEAPKAIATPEEAPGPEGWTPMQLAIYHKWQIFPKSYDVYGLGLGLSTTQSNDVIGAQIAPVAAIADGDVGILQASAIASVAEGYTRGFQLSGIASVASGGVWGVQGAGIASAAAEGNASGLQVAGVASFAEGDVRGVQIGGLAAASEGDVIGLETGGFAALCEGDLRGIQAAGLAVFSRGARGVQVAGLAASSEGDLRGIQVGGIAAVTEENGWGWQAAGVASVTEGAYYGLQTSGIVNSGRSVWGMQGALVYNVGSVRGMQLSLINGPLPIDGFINQGESNECRGLQLGAVNNFGHSSGLQAGIVNLRQKGEEGTLNGLQLGVVNNTGPTSGVQFGLINFSDKLDGAQVGLLNFEGGKLRFPLFNFRFGSKDAE